MKSKKITIELTETQLYEAVNCVEHCYERAMGYGHITRSEQNLAAANRLRLIFKLRGPLIDSNFSQRVRLKSQRIKLK